MSNALIVIPEKLASLFFMPGYYYISVEDHTYRNSCVFDMVSNGFSAAKIEEAVVNTIAMNPLLFRTIVASEPYKKAAMHRGLSGSTANILIGHTIRDSLAIKGRIDQAFRIIANAAYKTRGNFTVPSGKNNEYSFCRNEDGRLRDKSEFKVWVKNITYARNLFTNALAHDDLEACELLLERASIRKLIEPNLKEQIIKMNLGPDAACNALVRKKITGINDYVVSLFDFAKARDPANVNRIYDASLSPSIGHEVVSLLAYSLTKTESDLMGRLYLDGADWFMGLSQSIHGHAVYFDLKDREKSTQQEMLLLLSMMSKYKLGASVKNLWKLFPKEVVLDIADSEKTSEQLHVLTGYSELLKIASRGYKRKLISAEMSL
jgi:hypothetical protein